MIGNASWRTLASGNGSGTAFGAASISSLRYMATEFGLAASISVVLIAALDADSERRRFLPAVKEREGIREDRQ